MVEAFSVTYVVCQSPFSDKQWMPEDRCFEANDSGEKDSTIRLRYTNDCGRGVQISQCYAPELLSNRLFTIRLLSCWLVRYAREGKSKDSINGWLVILTGPHWLLNT